MEIPRFFPEWNRISDCPPPLRVDIIVLYARERKYTHHKLLTMPDFVKHGGTHWMYAPTPPICEETSNKVNEN